MTISVSFPFSRVAQPEARRPSSLLDAVFSTASFLQLFYLQTPWISCALSYIIVQRPLNLSRITGHRNIHFWRLWNGIFDRHRAEITVTQFTGHSLPVNQFWLYRGILTLSHIVSQAHPRQQNMHFRRLWNGMFCRVGGQYTTQRQICFVLSELFCVWNTKCCNFGICSFTFIDPRLRTIFTMSIILAKLKKDDYIRLIAKYLKNQYPEWFKKYFTFLNINRFLTT